MVLNKSTEHLISANICYTSRSNKILDFGFDVLVYKLCVYVSSKKKKKKGIVKQHHLITINVKLERGEIIFH